MPICTRCSHEIKSLKVKVVQTGELIISERGRLAVLKLSNFDETTYSCPECNEIIDTLTNSPHLATRFLKTGKMF